MVVCRVWEGRKGREACAQGGLLALRRRLAATVVCRRPVEGRVRQNWVVGKGRVG